MVSSLSSVLPTSQLFTSGYVNTETILHFFYEITNERASSYNEGKRRACCCCSFGFSAKNYYLNYFINEFHLSFYNGHSEFIFFPLKVRILLEAGALVECPSTTSEDVGI